MVQPAGKPPHHPLSDQISSLITLSHSIKPFSSRWNLITTKLNHILPLLSPEPQNSDHDSTFSGVFQAIEETTQFATELALKCIDCSYTGKLLMQSDLDIICATFNNHIRLLSELHSVNCVPTDSDYAIVVSRPGHSAAIDDIRFYVSDLLSRFKIGGSEMKKGALICFNEVIGEDERFLKVAMEGLGFVYGLIELLNSKDFGIQEEVLKSLDLICGFDGYKGVLVSVSVGGVAALIKVLESGSDLGKNLSTRCLMKCTAECENAWAVSAHGGVTSLLRISACERDNGELVGLACGVLRNLVGVEEIKRFIVEEGALPMFINLVRSRNEVSQIGAMELIKAITSGDQVVTSLIFSEGGVRVLVQILDPRSSFSSKARETSIMVIMSLWPDSTRLYSLVSYGFMDHILHFLKDGDISVQESCLKAAFWLSGISDDFKKAMGDAGFMQEIIEFVGAKSFEVRDMASQTLMNLVSIPKNRKRFVESDQNVSLIMQSVDQVGTLNDRKLLLPIIMSLSRCNSGRKKILSCGYLKNIEKLADDQVSDATQIISNLSSNRFVRMLRGLWH